MLFFFFFKQKTAYEMRISDWSSDVCSSDLPRRLLWARSMTHAAPAPAPETLPVQKTRIACDGTGDGLADAALGHPRVWLEIDPHDGYADCGYFDRHFILIGGIAATGVAPAETPTPSSTEHTHEPQPTQEQPYSS